jgi:hypothetical protein
MVDFAGLGTFVPGSGCQQGHSGPPSEEGKMRRMTLALVAVLALAGGAAQADHGNQPNTHGHCTAYFNGSETGQENKRKATAFEEFATYVANNDHVDNDGDEEVDEGDETATPVDIWNFCMDPENNPKGVGGQPDDPNTEENDGNGNSGRGNG